LPTDFSGIFQGFFDGFVKSRHFRAGGNPESAKLLKKLDSRFHGNDGKAHFQTFCEIIKFVLAEKPFPAKII